MLTMFLFVKLLKPVLNFSYNKNQLIHAFLNKNQSKTKNYNLKIRFDSKFYCLEKLVLV